MKKILVGVITLLILVRLALPSLLLSNFNKFLNDFSPEYTAYISDVDISILRMAYRLEGITAKLKKGGEQFLNADAVDISLSWRELFKARVLADIDVDGLHLRGSPSLLDRLKGAEKPPQKDAKDLGDKFLPLDIERVVVRNSSADIMDVPGVPPKTRFFVDSIESQVSNLTPQREDSKTLATLKASVLGSATLKGVATAYLKGKSAEWDTDIELRGFDLKAANPMLARMLPFTFTKGTMDLFAEVKSEGGNIEGYIKPFLKKIDVVGGNSDFKGGKHFLIEVGGALTNLILRRSEDKTLATKIGFRTENGALKFDTEGAVANAFEHGFDEKIQMGLEDNVSIKP